MMYVKPFLKKRNHWGPLLKSVDPSWLGEYPLKTGVPPSFAFIKQRPVREGHTAVQDTSFAKIGRDIPVQELHMEINI